MKYFNSIILMIKISKLRKNWNNFKKISYKIRSLISEKKKFIIFIGNDSDDLIANEDILKKYDSEISELKKQKVKLKKKLTKFLFKFGLFNNNEELFLKFSEYNIKPEKVEFLKEIRKEYLKSQK